MKGREKFMEVIIVSNEFFKGNFPGGQLETEETFLFENHQYLHIWEHLPDYIVRGINRELSLIK